MPESNARGRKPRPVPEPKRDDLMTIDDIRAELGIGRTNALRLVSEGVLPKLPHIKRVLVPRHAFEAFIRGESTNGHGK